MDLGILLDHHRGASIQAVVVKHVSLGPHRQIA